MAGNRQIYEQAMSMGHSAAWDHEWEKAIAAYGRAVQEFPEDPAAHNSLGLALLQARRLEDALKVYTRAHQLAPDDPLPLEKSADVLERLGRLKDAAQQYINVAEIYLAQKDLEKAIGNWERATRLTSGLVQIHQRLALAYERTGQRRSAIREYLTLAFNFQRANRTDIALQAVERALRIDPQNPQALNTQAALQSGALITPELLEDEEEAAASQAHQTFETTPVDLEDSHEPGPGEADSRGPVGEAIEMALSSLATYVFESGMMERGSTDAIQAIEFQRQGMHAEAVGAYQRALAAKMRHPAIYMNLGALLLDMERWNDAIKHFEQAAQDNHFAAGAMHGMSRAYVALKKPREAAHHLIQSLRMVDLGLAMSPNEVSEITAVYDRLTSSINGANEQQLREMNDHFLGMLSGPVWKQQIAETRRQLEEAADNVRESLVTMVRYIDPRLTEGMTLIEQYSQSGLYNLAIDEAHYLLENWPDYLPLHRRIGQILLDRDNIQAAMVKYNLVAKTYLVRGEKANAADVLQEALRVAPMDVSLHQSLIELLEEDEQWESVLDQYIELADAYYELADMESARATYQKALQLSQRISAPSEKVIRILHHIGDIDISRFDLRQAMRTYEQIRKMNPEDERARRALVDLNYRLNDPVTAVRELDALLRVFAKQRRANRIIQVLEEEVTRYPNEMALRSRLAAVYRQVGQVPKAVEQLDSLAELQLEAGLHNDAVTTIQQIIAMNPANVGDYKRLLQQLSGRVH